MKMFEKLQQARQRLHQQNEVDDYAITILEQEEEHIKTTARRWFSRGGLDYLWQRTQDTGELQMDGWVELRVWCTDDAELFQRTTADDLPDLTSFAGSPGNRINETDDNTDEEVDFGISDHSSDDLSHHSIDATDYGAFRPGEWDFNAENNDSDDETW
ncbi:BZ3500_MvSof-1268-A1-R1_Chr6-3g09012 [Microbotryum saponariae]|uniref:BZ3500_MvSof-1268-A1-R1_Chr6-3g09012 protein n=1 Tax=Microbotryum saponariae TaxID=289078 RepID=A0A2X0MPV3_9BASI|nr:BZ3500_MvSof-1268-A1-R1_Chr6-3g09012 [Microbotryum saponariae]SDA07614.1 BZ3501_MvSof-1269-A2-R1_Chr6-2g08716 [Microbotryum saponariae]